MSEDDRKLPGSPSSWEAEAKKFGVDKTGISELLGKDIKSASKIVDKQYYALRVLWQSGPRRVEYEQLGLGLTSDVIREARDFLGHEGHETSWQRYLNDLLPITESSSTDGKDGVRDGVDIGSFSVICYTQMRVQKSYKLDKDAVERDANEPLLSPRMTRSKARPREQTNEFETPSRPPRGLTQGLDNLGIEDQASLYEGNSLEQAFMAPSPFSPASGLEHRPAEDEQIVNTALLIFLQGLTIHHKELCFNAPSSPEWTLKRLKLDFRTPGQGKDWEARTDGFLRIAGKTKALVEVKPYLRKANKSAIQKQESAQMAAWIAEEPNDGIIDVDTNNKKVERSVPCRFQDDKAAYSTASDDY